MPRKGSRELSKRQVLAIFNAEGSHVAIGAEHGVSAGYVGAIKRGEYHQALTGGKRTRPKRKPITIALIRAVLAAEGSYTARARQFGLSHETVLRYARLLGVYDPELRRQSVHRGAMGRFAPKPGHEVGRGARTAPAELLREPAGQDGACDAP